MVYSKRIAIFYVKKTLSNSCLTDQTVQREKENQKIQFFLSVLASMTGRWV